MQGRPSITAKFLVSCLLLLTGLACADTITGKVIGAMDGDTIEVLGATKTSHRIRLEGIDAPEKAQPFGARSEQHLSDQVFGKPVEVLSNKTDKYGRTVGKVVIGSKDSRSQPATAVDLLTGCEGSFEVDAGGAHHGLCQALLAGGLVDVIA